MSKCECGYTDNADGLPFCGLCGGIRQPIEFPIVEITNELVQLCSEWHNGQASAMYSVASMGTIHDADILRGLSADLRHVVRLASRPSQSPSEEDSDPCSVYRDATVKTAERWLTILERWEETLPDSGEW